MHKHHLIKMKARIISISTRHLDWDKTIEGQGIDGLKKLCTYLNKKLCAGETRELQVERPDSFSPSRA